MLGYFGLTLADMLDALIFQLLQALYKNQDKYLADMHR
jgi:hypothetical protein